ncbi:MAG: TRAP transporter substrate-binding protein, partial [Polaromonas sp.]
MIFRRKLIAVAALAAAAFISPLAAQAQTVLKAADVHPTGYPTVAATENLGKKFEAATNGKYKLQMFPNSVLGDE